MTEEIDSDGRLAARVDAVFESLVQRSLNGRAELFNDQKNAPNAIGKIIESHRIKRIDHGFYARLLNDSKRRTTRIVLLVTILSFFLTCLLTINPHYVYVAEAGLNLGESVAVRQDIETQKEILRSGKLASGLIKALRLSSLAEFDPILSGYPALYLLAGEFGLVSDPFERTPQERVLDSYYERLTIDSSPDHRKLAVKFRSSSAQLSAAVVRSLIEADTSTFGGVRDNSKPYDVRTYRSLELFRPLTPVAATFLLSVLLSSAALGVVLFLNRQDKLQILRRLLSLLLAGSMNLLRLFIFLFTPFVGWNIGGPSKSAGPDSADLALLAKLRAHWLKPKLSEKWSAFCFLVLPAAIFHIAVLFSLAPDGKMLLARISQFGSALGVGVVRHYRKRRRQMQAELNERALELTQTGSDFILYLRSFNTSNRLRVRNTMPNTLDRLLVGLHWDVEFAFSYAFEHNAPLVAIGSKGKGIGAAKIQSDDAHWENLFRDLAERAKAILVVPSMTPGTRHEVSTIAQTDSLLRKTIWVMPPTYWGVKEFFHGLLTRSHRKNWEATRAALSPSLILPQYRRAGALIYTGYDGKDCKVFSADDLAEDRLRTLIDAVAAASDMESDRRSLAVNAIASPERPWKYHLEEWLFRRWVAGLGRRVKTGLLIACLGLLFVSTFIFDAVGPMPSVNMFPTLMPGDVVSLTEYSYVLDRSWNPPAFLAWTKWAFGRLPNRGDVIAVRLEHDESKMLLGRVIGLPGDTVKLQGGVFYVNGAPIVQQSTDNALTGTLSEMPVSPECRLIKNIFPGGAEFKSIICLKGFRDSGEFVIPADKLYVLGDAWIGPSIGGYVSIKDLVGKANFVLYSLRPAKHGFFGRLRLDRFFKPL